MIAYVSTENGLSAAIRGRGWHLFDMDSSGRWHIGRSYGFSPDGNYHQVELPDEKAAAVLESARAINRTLDVSEHMSRAFGALLRETFGPYWEKERAPLDV